MDTMQLTKAPVMKTGMLIRRPVAEVFEAFIDQQVADSTPGFSTGNRSPPGG